MKVLIIALCMILFNIGLAAVSQSGIFVGSVSYDDSYFEKYEDGMPSNVSAIEEDQQYTQSMNIIGLMFSSLSWNWVYQFVPDPVDSSIGYVITGLNAFTLALIGIGFVELFTKRTMV